MARLREYKGDTKCSCGKDLPVYLTGGGMLTSSCGWCRQQVHCPVGSFSFRVLEQSLRKGVDPEKDNNKSPAASEQAKPAAMPKVVLKTKIPPKEDAPKEMQQTPPKPVERTIFDIFTKG